MLVCAAEGQDYRCSSRKEGKTNNSLASNLSTQISFELSGLSFPHREPTWEAKDRNGPGKPQIKIYMRCQQWRIAKG